MMKSEIFTSLALFAFAFAIYTAAPIMADALAHHDEILERLTDRQRLVEDHLDQVIAQIRENNICLNTVTGLMPPARGNPSIAKNIGGWH